MLFLLFLVVSIICTGLVVYYEQFLKDGILYWSIPLLIIGFLVGIILFFVLSLLIISYFVQPDKKMSRPRKFYQKVIAIVAEFLTGLCRLKLVKIGFDKIPSDKQFLVVCNHQSNIDPIVSVWALHRYHITYIMKDSIMKVPILGRWLYGGGYLPLDRKNDRKAAETIVLATKRITDNLHPIVVYPEGTRSKGPNMNEFRNGVFKIAQKAQCPIVILALDNAYRFKWHFPWRRTKILLEIVDVLEYESFKDLNTNDLGEIIHKKIKDTLTKRRNEFCWLKKIKD